MPTTCGHALSQFANSVLTVPSRIKVFLKLYLYVKCENDKVDLFFTSVDWKTSASAAAFIEETQSKKRKLPDWLCNIESTSSPKTKPSTKKKGILIGSYRGVGILLT